MISYLRKKWVGLTLANRTSRRSRPDARKIKLHLEQLEERAVPSSTLITDPSNTSIYGTNPSFTATVSGIGTPAGTVTFTIDGGTPSPAETLVGGAYTYTPPALLAVGPHSVIATYTPSDSNTGSTSPTFTQTVDYTPGDLIVTTVGTDTLIGTIASIAETSTTATITTAATKYPYNRPNRDALRRYAVRIRQPRNLGPTESRSRVPHRLQSQRHRAWEAPQGRGRLARFTLV